MVCFLRFTKNIVFSNSTWQYGIYRVFFSGKEFQTKINFGKKNDGMHVGLGRRFQPVQDVSIMTGECSDYRQMLWNYVSATQYVEYLAALICGRSL